MEICHKSKIFITLQFVHFTGKGVKYSLLVAFLDETVKMQLGSNVLKIL